MADGRTDHDAHDPLLIAALLDRDASATERAAADDRRRSCPDCAALYADLLALAGAVREQPAAPRVRDFVLTAADADRLTAERTGEPGPAATRLSGVMTMRPDTAGHAGHDTMLVASLADHSLERGRSRRRRGVDRRVRSLRRAPRGPRDAGGSHAAPAHAGPAA